MAEYERDPSANTGRFRAFVEQAQAADRTTSPAKSRGLLIGGAVLALIIIIILAVTL